MKEIPLTKGYVALVDDEDYPRLAIHKWHANICDKRVYARRVFGGRKNHTKVYMHREITEAYPNEEIDHRVGIGLDNRRHNLRRATRTQQRGNQGVRPNSRTGVKGVKPHQGKFMSTISHSGKAYYIGVFDKIEDGAKAYAAKAVELYGEFARLA